ncbi:MULTISPECIES: hypothetical protein [unclassified Erwinia]|uniref:hypothetical protein n=1 Tax=unclassified Erwinia TaxID=2622719 RepID=UPI0006F5E6F7|nr:MULTISPECIES: hypothetical protein [unclassified Erwinia]KQN64429.1 hypothetical protein ASF13_00675 [Erwinia sp. Leaf53]
MSLPGSGIVAEVTQSLEQHPLWTLLAVLLLVVIPLLMKWFCSELKLEHLLQYTLNNRIKFIKGELKDNLMSEEQRADYQAHYHRLLNQKTYGIKNPQLQAELAGVIRSSSDILDVKYFRPHQYILSLNENKRVFVDGKKVSQRRIEACVLIAMGITLIVLGLAVIQLYAPMGIFIMALGLLLYFATLGHFPANFRVRKHLQAQFDTHYSQQT